MLQSYHVTYVHLKLLHYYHNLERIYTLHIYNHCDTTLYHHFKCNCSLEIFCITYLFYFFWNNFDVRMATKSLRNH